MSWTWSFSDAEGAAVAPQVLADAAGDAVVGGARSPGAAPTGDEPVPFASQGDAETWLGEHWRVLAAAGAHEAALLDDGRQVYGPLRLALPLDR